MTPQTAIQLDAAFLALPKREATATARDILDSAKAGADVPAELFEAALVVLAREDVRVFAQFILRDEDPGAVGLKDGESWSLYDAEADGEELDPELTALGDAIELQDYHLELLEAFATNQFLSVVAHTESGKTQLAIAYALWRLGRDPRMRIAIVSEGAKLARQVCRTIAKYIADETFPGCRAVRRVFPELKPGSRWGDEGYEVARPKQITHYSFAPYGEKSSLTGPRLGLIILDDYITPKTTATPYMRQQNADNFDRKVQNRITARGQIISLCNAQWSDDLSARLESRGYTAHRMRVTKDGTPDGPLEWPERWTRLRIREKIQINPDWRAMLFAVRRQVGEHGRFRDAAIKAALLLGKGRTLGLPLRSFHPESIFCIGMDFAFGGADSCAIAVVAVEPPAEGEAIGRRVLADIRVGKWTDGEAVEQLREVVNRYPEDRTFIRGESNAAQKWVVANFSRQIGRMIQPYRTGGSKWSPDVGIPALAAAFDNGLWVLPSDQFGDATGDVAILVSAMKAFDPARAGQDHTGDALMALFFADDLARVKRPFIYRGGFAGETGELGVQRPPTQDDTEAPGPPPRAVAPAHPGPVEVAPPAPRVAPSEVVYESAPSWDVESLTGGGSWSNPW